MFYIYGYLLLPTSDAGFPFIEARQFSCKIKVRNYSWAPMANACNPVYSGGLRLEASLGKYFTRPCLENTQHTHQKIKAGGVAQVVEHLPSTLKALSSNSNATHKKREIAR
jgi:hypothetical protein